jgi:hypothetical protein
LRGKKLVKKLKNIDDMTSAEINQQAHSEKMKELARDAIQIARDLDYPVRYAILDPYGTSLMEVNNISPDCMLIEQLHAEIDEFDVLRQVQALRSLAKISTYTPSSNLPVVPVPGAGVGGDDKGDRDREKERDMR